MPQLTKFEGEARLRLQSLISEFDAYIAKENPDHQSYHKGTRDWKKKKAKALMTEKVFKKLLDEGKKKSIEYKDWEQAIIRFFTNHYNNRYLPKTDKDRLSKSPETAVIAEYQPANDQLTSILQSALCFFGDLPARALFIEDTGTQSEIREKMNELKIVYPGLNNGALRNKAVKALWDAADQEYWKERVQDVKGDLKTNREHLPLIMHHALQDLATRDCLGSIALSFSFAYRDTNTDGIKGATQPCSQAPKPIHAIGINAEGLDLAHCSPNQLAALLNEYFLALWHYSSFPMSDANGIPWQVIVSRPSAYYDAEIFRLPVPLSNPILLKGNAVALFSLADYLLSFEAAAPVGQALSKTSRELTSTSPPIAPVMPPIIDTASTTPAHSANAVANDAPSFSLFASRDSEHAALTASVAAEHVTVTQPEQPKTHSEPVPPPCIFETATSSSVPSTAIATSGITVQKGRKRSRKSSMVNPVPARELRRREQPAAAAVSGPPKKKRKSKKELWHYEDMEGNLVDKHGNRIDEEGNRIFPEN
ncbi:hypothetical protein CPC08DRAFT_766264 [Agrocybe pediades]|nr:hypothetical protein CPC08DRAFT_766264 [Agrocybe pediades]